MHTNKEKEIVSEVCNNIYNSMATRIGADYTNALKLIAQVVFTRSSGFLLELIQNAEDAGSGLNRVDFQITFNANRMKVTHNGRPFNQQDFEAICGIRSSKKPEKGTLGYLGIGFKSVFKITDSPEIYSGGFQFKFDRNYWTEPGNIPWHVLPIWVDSPSEEIDSAQTTFILPFREHATYQVLDDEIKPLDNTLYLFLQRVKKIEIVNEISGWRTAIENQGDIDGITTLKKGPILQKFKFFRRTVHVPDWVKEDRLTQEYRPNVTKREIALAFALDDKENLNPFMALAMYGGVYSFLPLGGEHSGLNFPIQADFLVQPGRDAINYEAKWNHWLLREIFDLCKESISDFKKHDKWKYQFLPMFGLGILPGQEAHKKLFGPELLEPLRNFLQTDDCVPTEDGEWARWDQVVQLDENDQAVDALVKQAIIPKNEIPSIFTGQDGLKLIHPNAKPYLQQQLTISIKKISRDDLLSNTDYLHKMSIDPNGAAWFTKLYLWLYAFPFYPSPKQLKRYHDYEIILTANGELLKGGSVYLPVFGTLLIDNIVSCDPLLYELVMKTQNLKDILHHGIMTSLSNEEERQRIRTFLTGFTGVQIMNIDSVCREGLHMLSVATEKLDVDTLIELTIYFESILKGNSPKDIELWVVTKDGDIKPAHEVLFSSEYKSGHDWEINKIYMPSANFLSPKYIENIINQEELESWRQFFKNSGVKDAPDNGVEAFAICFVKEQLEKKYQTVTTVEKQNLGYDLVASRENEEVYVEVKGISHDTQIELSANETQAADIHKNKYYLYIVSSIPENPTLYRIINPSYKGKKDRVVFPVDLWKQFKC